ncbi:MAG: hypothetical protein WA021_04010, partial [Minisyncoccia bacterium]
PEEVPEEAPEENPQEEVPVEEETEIPAPPESEEPAPEEVATTTPEETPQPEVQPELQPEPELPEPTPEPEVEGASTTEPLPETPPEESEGEPEAGRDASFAAWMQTLAHLAGRATAATAIAQEIAESTPENPNVALCKTLGTTCYTLEFTGFVAPEELVEKRLQDVELNFSFASKAPEDALADDKLIVRYFLDGEWKQAGEIYLNKELSNAENGGYFRAALADVDEWGDLSEIKVVVEYDRLGRGPAELYLDGLWIDAEYKERMQDVLSGEVDPEAPDDALISGSDSRTLVMQNGESISFNYLDDLDDNLAVRVDKRSYDARAQLTDGDISRNVVQAAITNTSDSADTFVWYVAFPGGNGRAIDAAQYVRNIASTSLSSIQDDVTYLCEASWARITADRYRCEATGEEHVCEWLNESRQNCLVEDVTVGVSEDVEYYSDWLPFAIEGAPNIDISGDIPEGYGASAASEKTFEILPGQTLYFRFVLESPEIGAQRFALLALGDSYDGDVESELLQEEGAWVPPEEEINTNLSKRTEFSSEELPAFKFRFATQRNFFSRISNYLIGREDRFTINEVRLRHESGTYEVIPVEIEFLSGDEWTLSFKKQPRAFRPGKYSLEVDIYEDGETFTDSVHFYWGVLAINSEQSVYAPGESAHLMMAVLTETGDTICDAILDLVVVDPAGVAHTVPVEPSGLCSGNNVVDIADYLAEYTVGEIGEYSAVLSRIDAGGNVVHRVTDSFSVRENDPFVISRTGAMRIYPVANYRMELELRANMDFEGEFIEAVPEDFVIVDDGDAEIRMYGNAKRLVWPVSLKAGESVRVAYEYDAPDISPYLYLLGPAEVRSGEAIPFSETRQWKIASDAVGNMLLYWDQTWIPAGWTCVSCVPADPFYQRFVVGSSTASVNGGAATHTHTATGNVDNNVATGVSATGGGTADTAVNTHNHSYTPVIASASNLPPYRQLSLIQYSVAGEPPTIPNGAIAVFDVASSSLPAGWFRYAVADGRYIRSEATSTIGTTGGLATHTHSITGTTGVASAGTNAPGTTGVSAANEEHTHDVATTTAAVASEPPYIEVLLAKVTATTTPTNTMIAMFTGDPATGWSTVSSTSEPLANRFIKASTTYGTTGGVATHTHASINNTNSNPTTATTNRTAGGTGDATGAHTHTVDITGFNTPDHQPPYRTAVFGKRVGGSPPAAPTLHDIPFNSEQTGTSTPNLEFTASDPDGSDTLIYQVQWDDDADLDSSPIGDRTSDVESGCSPNCFQNQISGGDLSPFNEAERMRFSIQTPLVSGTTYYWRTRAQETGGGGTWGSWTSTQSFTYIAGTDPALWFQTEDAQFDGNSLSNIETYGSDSARIVAAAPSEVLGVYGEGTTQTPRYRLWNGTAWGTEGSAQSVGGIIQWIVVEG